jgi:RNA polymerase sigma-70 factor (ECF subfamily)
MNTTIGETNTINDGQPAAVGWADERVLLAYRESNDPELFALLVHRFEREVYSYLRRYLGDTGLAEDAFQGTFLQLHLKCDQFQEGRKVRPWLYMIATNQAIDLQRRSKRHRMLSLNATGGNDTGSSEKLVDLLLSQEPGPSEAINDEESQRWVRTALRELPEYLGVVVNLVYFQGLKYREAAEVLSIPVGTVKSRLHAAILKLHELWKIGHQERP